MTPALLTLYNHPVTGRDAAHAAMLADLARKEAK